MQKKILRFTFYDRGAHGGFPNGSTDVAPLKFDFTVYEQKIHGHICMFAIFD